MKAQQLQARSQTDKKIAGATLEILSVYDDARKSINREIEKAYARYLAGIAPEDYYNELLKFDRLKKLQAEINSLYIAESVKAGRMTVAASKVAMSDAYYKNEYILSWFTPNVSIDLSFVPIPDELVALSVTGNLESWQKLGPEVHKHITSTFNDIKPYIPKEGTLSSILAQNRRAELLKINRAISSGLLQGDSYSRIAKGVKDIIGTVEGKVSTGAKAKALSIVRTEANRTYNAGAFANTQAVSAQGVDVKKMWSATLDSRTRDRHQSLDGQTRKPDEPFESAGAIAMFPGDFQDPSQNIRCRCTTIDIINDVPPSARLGVNPHTDKYQVFNWDSYPDWMAKMNKIK